MSPSTVTVMRDAAEWKLLTTFLYVVGDVLEPALSPR
jgi:hypothetical protein